MSFLKCPSSRLWTIPVVLCLMALVQRYNAEATNLHPWKGGGFGMFAAVPPVHLMTMKTNDGKLIYKTPTPQVLHRMARVLSTHPTDARANEFGQAVLALDWYLVQGADGAYPVTRDRLQNPDGATPVKLVGYDINISQYKFVRDGCKMVHAPLAHPLREAKGR